jgi:hypothetical protein
MHIIGLILCPACLSSIAELTKVEGIAVLKLKLSQGYLDVGHV